MSSTTDSIAELAALRQRVAELEAELAESQQFIGGLEKVEAVVRGHFHGLGVGMAVFSARRLQPQFLSYTVEQILGRSRQELQAEPELWMSDVAPDDLEVLRDTLRNARGGEQHELEFRLLRNGVRWIRSRISAGPSGYVMVSFEDITDRRLAEKTLLARDAQYRRIVETTYEGVVQVDAQFRITFVNARMAEIMGARVEDMIGRQVFSLLPAGDQPRAKELKERRRKGVKETYQVLMPTPDGRSKVLQVSTAPLFDEQGKFTGSLGMVSDLTDQTRAEHAVRASEERFRALAIHSPTGVFQCDLEARCLFINDRYATITGLPPQSATGMDWLRTLHPEDRQQTCAAWAKAVQAEGEFAHEFRFLHDDGSIRWVWGHAVPLRDELGRVASYLGNLLDITDRKQAEESLRASEQRFRLLSNCSPVGIFLSDQHGDIVYANPRFQAIAGLPAASLLGRGFLAAIHPEEREEVDQSWQQVMTSDNLHEAERRYLKPDGQCRFVQVRSSPLVSPQGAVVGRVGTVEDVTERRNFENQLRESEERYRLLAEHSTDMISKHTPDGTYVYVSPASRQLFGYEPEELIGQHPIDQVHPDDVASTWAGYAAIAERPRVGTVAARIRRKDGSYVWVESLAKTLPDDDPHGPGMIIAVTRDITQRKRAEDLLHESEKLAAAGRLAARIAHEINNPLAGIRNSFLLIEDAIPRHHPYYSYLERIENEIDRIARIVRRMFDLYRPEPIRRQPMELDRTIRDVVALLDAIATSRDVRLRVNSIESSRCLRLPEDSIRQVLYNLVINAIEASPSGGEVQIDSVADDAVVQVMVRDQGQGIDAELKSQIYEPFFTTKEQTNTGGLGLGLPISRGIVEALQGSLEFECLPEQGTLFRFTIPHSGEREG